MSRFLKDGENENAAPSETCPLCRIWSSYVRDMANAVNGGRALASFDREQAHAFLTAGFWAGMHKKDLRVCEVHAMQIAIIDTQNADTEPPTEQSQS